MPELRLEIRDGRIRLEHIFRARLGSAALDRNALPTLTYQKRIEVAEHLDVETENLTCVGG